MSGPTDPPEAGPTGAPAAGGDAGARTEPLDPDFLPPGRAVELPGRGTTFVRELPGPAVAGEGTVLLLHGWTVTADVNFCASYQALGRHFRVVALDHRGHGRGIRSRKPFTLADCADDAAALVDVLGTGPVIAVGYSMGGPIAQLLWKRHPETVLGLVLCATARNFTGTNEERLSFFGIGGLAVAARLTPQVARERLGRMFVNKRPGRRYEDWAMEQIQRNDWTAVLEAGRALGRFSSREWVGQIDVPVSVLVTERDTVVPPRRQQRLLESIPGAVRFGVDADHGACVMAADRFVPALLAGCRSVVHRGRARS